MTFGRALWFFVKIAVVVTIAVLLANRPGHMSITWLGYNIDLAVGTALAVLVIFSRCDRDSSVRACGTIQPMSYSPPGPVTRPSRDSEMFPVTTRSCPIMSASRRLACLPCPAW